jgi:hypothetical protein
MDDDVPQPTDGGPSLLRQLWRASQGWLIVGLGACVPPIWTQVEAAAGRRPEGLTDAEWSAWRDLERHLRAMPGPPANRDLSGER